VALAEQDAARYGVSLEVNVPPDVPLVRGDRVQISQVLLNLVVNGIDAVSAADGKERKVRIEAARSGAGRVEVTVLDSGTGIAPELLPRLFDAFVTTKPGGLGIGLALSRSIVQAHGGDLHARNLPQGGAAIRFTLDAG